MCFALLTVSVIIITMCVFSELPITCLLECMSLAIFPQLVLIIICFEHAVCFLCPVQQL